MAEPIPGGVFSETIDGGRAGCALRVGPSGLTAQTDEGAAFQLPFAGMQVEMGGASGRMVFCRPPDRKLTLFSEDPRLLAELLLATRGELRGALEELEGRRRRGILGRVVLLACAAGVIALLVAVVPPLVRSGAEAALTKVPYEVDEKLGAVALSAMELHTYEDARVRQVMDALLARLTPATTSLGIDLPVKWELSVAASSEINAFALPGGRIVIHTELLKTAKTPEQVAGVLAHEMSHVLRRHGVTAVAQSLGVVGGLQLMLGDVGGLLGLGRDLAGIAAVNGYSQSQESQADSDAVKLLLAAEIDPAALEEMLGLMTEKSVDVPSALGWLGTHPETAERRAAIRQARGKDAPRTRPLSAGWDQARVALAEKGGNK